jgi:CDP-glucose 4,6-dehydratase
MTLNRKNFLVTGATGFLGGHIAESLIQQGGKVYFTYNNLKKNQIKQIFHFAGLLPNVHKQPTAHDFFSVNLIGTLNVLEAARQTSGIEAVIIPSSTRVFDPSVSTHPYDASKIACEILVRSYFKTHGLPVVIGRVGNVFGAGDMSLNRIVPDILQSTIKNKTLIIKSAGKSKKNFIYIKDMVQGFIGLGENISRSKGLAINFLGKENLSVLELIVKISKALNQKCKYEVLNQIIDKQRLPKLDAELALKVLGWQPKYSFEMAMRETYKWYKKFLL